MAMPLQDDRAELRIRRPDRLQSQHRPIDDQPFPDAFGQLSAAP
jgi:hypothetical protein